MQVAVVASPRWSVSRFSVSGRQGCCQGDSLTRAVPKSANLDAKLHRKSTLNFKAYTPVECGSVQAKEQVHPRTPETLFNFD
jgi:hypothetical protein